MNILTNIKHTKKRETASRYEFLECEHIAQERYIAKASSANKSYFFFFFLVWLAKFSDMKNWNIYFHILVDQQVLKHCIVAFFVSVSMGTALSINKSLDVRQDRDSEKGKEEKKAMTERMNRTTFIQDT